MHGFEYLGELPVCDAECYRQRFQRVPVNSLPPSCHGHLAMKAVPNARAGEHDIIGR